MASKCQARHDYTTCAFISVTFEFESILVSKQKKYSKFPYFIVFLQLCLKTTTALSVFGFLEKIRKRSQNSPNFCPQDSTRH